MKIYSVTFNEYTNYAKDTVSNGETIGSGNVPYVHVGNQPFLITEEQIIAASKYGKGIKEMIFVGNLWCGGDTDG